MSHPYGGLVDEDYAGALLVFQEWCVAHDVPFKQAMREAMAAHMGMVKPADAPAPAPARAGAELTVRERMKRGRRKGVNAL